MTLDRRSWRINYQNIMKASKQYLFIKPSRVGAACVAAGILLTILPGCGQTERTEAITAEITAAQMQGRNSASEIIVRNWPDTTELMISLRKAREKKCRYDSTGHPECAAAFDSAFLQTLRAVKPEIGKIASRDD